MRKNKRYIVPLMGLLIACLCVACDNSEIDTPSFLHVDGISLKAPEQNAVSTDSGFYVSNIVAAYVALKRTNTHSLDTLGLFYFPFTTPVLYNGDVEYIELSPAVPMSGKYSQVPYYTFYKRIKVEDTTMCAGDTLNLGVVSTTYDITQPDLLLFEPFEPTEGSIKFDSVMQWEKNADPSEARSGVGYGYVHVPDSCSYVDFKCTRDFVVANPTDVLYLELDTRSDIEFEVLMYASELSGGNPQEFPVMRIYPSTEWKHIYVNLGRTWQSVNYNPQFQIHFSALNTNSKEGDVRIDNVKVIKTSKTN